MRNKLLILGFVFSITSLALPQASFAAEKSAQKQVTAEDLAAPPDATIDYDAEQFRLILGGSKGKGILHFQGKDYPFTMKGASVGGVGASAVQGAGVVHNLKRAQDFAGHYVGIGIGAVVVKGKGASSYQNGKGVVVTVKSKADGAALNMGLGAIDVALSK